MIDRVALAELLTSANRYTPPKPEALTALGKMIEAEPAFFNMEARLTRFDVDRDGKPRSGYGFTAQVEQNPIYELAFCMADLVREGLRPEYLAKLYGLAVAHPKWLGLAADTQLPAPVSADVAKPSNYVTHVTKPGGPTITGAKMTAAERKRRSRQHQQQ